MNPSPITLEEALRMQVAVGLGRLVADNLLKDAAMRAELQRRYRRGELTLSWLHDLVSQQLRASPVHAAAVGLLINDLATWEACTAAMHEALLIGLQSEATGKLNGSFHGSAPRG
jgi:hypothetical protein